MFDDRAGSSWCRSLPFGDGVFGSGRSLRWARFSLGIGLRSGQPPPSPTPLGGDRGYGAITRRQSACRQGLVPALGLPQGLQYGLPDGLLSIHALRAKPDHPSQAWTVLFREVSASQSPLATPATTRATEAPSARVSTPTDSDGRQIATGSMPLSTGPMEAVTSGSSRPISSGGIRFGTRGLVSLRRHREICAPESMPLDHPRRKARGLASKRVGERGGKAIGPAVSRTRRVKRWQRTPKDRS